MNNPFYFQAHSSTYWISNVGTIWSPMSILLVKAESKADAIQMVILMFGDDSYILCMGEEEMYDSLSYYNFKDIDQAYPGGEVNIIDFI